ncbi:MAG: HU family DNA-binding protein [Pseudomonadota bacterium]|nr:HU family DNA-binding protein [Pseudomonadota bacterium]
MSRQELIKELRKKNPKLNKDDFETIIDAFCSGLEKALKDGKNIELRGFGTFFVKRISEKYSARNPKTGKLIYVPEKNKIRFKVSKKLKELINK